MVEEEEEKVEVEEGGGVFLGPVSILTRPLMERSMGEQLE